MDLPKKRRARSCSSRSIRRMMPPRSRVGKPISATSWRGSNRSKRRKYPLRDRYAAGGQGRADLSSHCAECHGTYGATVKYPEKCVPIDDGEHRSVPPDRHAGRTSPPIRHRLARRGGKTHAPSKSPRVTWRRRWTASGLRPRTCIMVRCRHFGTCSILTLGP